METICTQLISKHLPNLQCHGTLTTINAGTRFRVATQLGERSCGRPPLSFLIDPPLLFRAGRLAAWAQREVCYRRSFWPISLQDGAPRSVRDFVSTSTPMVGGGPSLCGGKGQSVDLSVIGPMHAVAAASGTGP